MLSSIVLRGKEAVTGLERCLNEIIGSAGKRHGPRPILKDPSKPSLIRSKSPFACSIYDEIKMSIASLSITPFSS